MFFWDRDSDVLQRTRTGSFSRRVSGSAGRFDLNGKMIVGNLQSKTALRLIREWARLHRPEMEANWGNMKAGKPLERIEPLQ